MTNNIIDKLNVIINGEVKDYLEFKIKSDDHQFIKIASKYLKDLKIYNVMLLHINGFFLTPDYSVQLHFTIPKFEISNIEEIESLCNFKFDDINLIVDTYGNFKVTDKETALKTSIDFNQDYLKYMEYINSHIDNNKQLSLEKAITKYINDNFFNLDIKYQLSINGETLKENNTKLSISFLKQLISHNLVNLNNLSYCVSYGHIYYERNSYREFILLLIKFDLIDNADNAEELLNI